MNCSRWLITILTLGLVAAVSLAWADVPGVITYQGVLTDPSGDAVSDGSYNITFTIYDASAAGSALWTSGVQSVPVEGGSFSYLLGSNVPFGTSLFDDTLRWLGIQVASDPEMTPRVRMTSVPYALKSGSSGGWTDAGAIVKLETASDDVGIGTDTPSGKLHVETVDEIAVYARTEGSTAAGMFYGSRKGVHAYVESESGSIDGVLGQIGLFSNSGNGVRGLANGGFSAIGVSGQANAASNTSMGVSGVANGPSTKCVAVDAVASGGTTNYGLWARTHEATASTTNYGTYSQAWGGDAINYGVYALAEYGATNYGIWAGISGGSGYAGYFDGDVHITGTLTGGGGGGGANGWIDDGATVRLETAGDEVGIGTSFPDAKLHVDASQIHAGKFESNTGMGDSAVLHAEFTGSGEMDAIAVYGSSTPADFWGIGGRFESNYIGVEGNAMPLGTDPSYVYIGAVGSASGGNARNFGVRGSASNCAQATGVYGGASGGTEFATGVAGAVGNNSSLSTGVMGSANGSGQFNHGVSGVATGSSANFNYGVFGQGHSSPNGNIGVYGSAVENYGWKRGVYGHASGTGDNYGLYGYATDGDATTNYGVYASAANGTTNYAGYFQGDVTITGTLTGGSPSMRIDHPEDPDNMYLQHASVVSPDMMTVYSGNIVTDSDSRAVVTLPNYFETLNGDFRYQLTVIGSFARAIVLEEIQNNQFVVATDQPNVKVSWQVTGIRKDPYAQAERLQTEIAKAAPEQGKYQHPGLFGAAIEKTIGAAEPLPVSEQIDRIVIEQETSMQKQ